MPPKIDWLRLEQDIRSILKELRMSPNDKLFCIDTLLAHHTRRGQVLPRITTLEYDRLAEKHPNYFPQVKDPSS